MRARGHVMPAAEGGGHMRARGHVMPAAEGGCARKARGVLSYSLLSG